MEAFKVLFACLCLWGAWVSAHEVCTDMSGPKAIPMTFCTDYNMKTCCTAEEDAAIQQQWNSLQIQSPTCQQKMKEILCSKCDPWGAHLFGVEDQNVRTVPILCTDYCSSFYTTCASENMNWGSQQSPFGSNIIQRSYRDVGSFCGHYETTNNYTACFNGSRYTPPVQTVTTPVSQSICVENVLTTDWDQNKAVYLISTPDNTDRLMVLYQRGVIDILNRTTYAKIGTFLDISARIVFGGEGGLLSMVFHPNFNTNRKFYLAFSVPPETNPIACTSVDECNGKPCGADGFCQGVDSIVVVEEFEVSTIDKNMANPTSIKRLTKVVKPFRNHNGGQLLFGPDGYLYVTSGDEGGGYDPNNNSQNLNRLGGKVLRIDVNGTSEHGPYGIPSDNPFVNRKDARPEVYAYGLRNPWRCSFDAARSSYLICADVGQDTVEEVDIIKKGANYGWKFYEGNQVTPGEVNLTLPASQVTFPVLTYTHQETGGGEPAIIGGYFYRGTADPCLYGKYLYGDYQGALFWAASETYPDSGQFNTARVSITCASDSPGCSQPGNMFSYGQDDHLDVYLLGSTRIVKIVNPSRCGQPSICPAPTPIPSPSSIPIPSASPSASSTQTSTSTSTNQASTSTASTTQSATSAGSTTGDATTGTGTTTSSSTTGMAATTGTTSGVTPQTLLAAEDTYVRGGAYSDANFGNHSNLIVSCGVTPGSDSDYQSYLRFDLGTLQPQNPILKLSLASLTSDSQQVSLQLTGSDNSSQWEANLVTWKNPPSMTPSLPEITTLLTLNSTTVSVDLSSWFTAALRSSQLTVQLKCTATASNNTVITFFSSEHGAETTPSLAFSTGSVRGPTGAGDVGSSESWVSASMRSLPSMWLVGSSLVVAIMLSLFLQRFKL